MIEVFFLQQDTKNETLRVSTCGSNVMNLSPYFSQQGNDVLIPIEEKK